MGSKVGEVIFVLNVFKLSSDISGKTIENAELSGNIIDFIGIKLKI